jgi:hypothetical protein
MLTANETYDFVDGKLVIRKSQDVQSLLDQNAYERENAPSMFGEMAVRKIGSIPLIVAETWAKECGAAVGTKEFAEYAKRKLMDGDFAKFRIKTV